jgi:ubiquinone/menaquinone biosynthesis C-methylase UbiE
MANLEEIYGVEQSKFFFSNLLKARQKIHNKIITYINDEDTILDIGTTPVILKHENYFLNHYKFKDKVTCLSNQNLEKLKSVYPNLKTILGDGRDTGLNENQFDITISNATLEHVGSFEQQKSFVKEMNRVSRKKSIIITPNRYYPLDTHTMLPFIHWLPKKIHRKLLKIFKYDFLSLEKNLNLLSTKDLIKICSDLNITNYHIQSINFMGFKSNLILIINKI